MYLQSPSGNSFSPVWPGIAYCHRSSGVVDCPDIEGGILSSAYSRRFLPEFHRRRHSVCRCDLPASATETIGDTTAMVVSGLDRAILIRRKRYPAPLACDGFASSILTVRIVFRVTSPFSQNVGLIATTKVANRFTIMTGAICMILVDCSRDFLLRILFRCCSGRIK